MTSSQWKTLIAGIAAFLGAVSAAVTPHIDIIPAQYRFYIVILSIITSALGSSVAAFNQSLSSEHISVPVDSAIQIGLDRLPGVPVSVREQIDSKKQ